MHVECDQERGAGAARVMDPDVVDPGLAAAQGEMAGEIPRLVGRALGSGEHEPGVLPGIIGGGPVAGLAFGAELKRGHADIG
jgi:hypothetical protein